jgi:ABC-type sugar transport system ATPase subunit
MSAIELRGVRKAFGPVTVIPRIDLAIESGEFVVLVGPSGCGKSTLLRMIAGLEEISGGEIAIGGRPVGHLPPSDRNVAMVFQDYALYPHMSVAENMGFGLRMRDHPAAEVDGKVRDASSVLKLDALLDRRPAQLSGGQRQRVAMGRAIVRDPDAFLFDEPLSNLDAALRVEMRLEIAKLHRRIRATTIYVTHDQVEAMTLADRIVVMNAGRMEQVGTPLELYHRPATLFVARFIGSPTMNTCPCELVPASDGGVVADLPDGQVRLPLAAGKAGGVILGIRPEDLTVCEPAEAWFAGTLVVVEKLGSQSFGYLEVRDGLTVTIALDRDTRLAAGDRIAAKGDPAALHLFDQATERRLV